MMLTFESAKFDNPSLEIIAEALKKGLKANYQEVTVEIINCPNLREWNCPSEGISCNERIIDVGGEPYMHDKQFIGTEFDYADYLWDGRRDEFMKESENIQIPQPKNKI